MDLVTCYDMANPTCEDSNGDGEEHSSTDNVGNAELTDKTESNVTVVALHSEPMEDNDTDVNLQEDETEEGNDISLVETLVGESNEVRKSLKKGITGSSENESDESSGSHVPAKRPKKSNGNPEPHPQTLKKTRDPFIQRKECGKMERLTIGKCLECRNQGSKGVCRFLSFRKLRYTERGSLTVAGFPNSECEKDYTEDDLKLWTPHKPPAEMTVDWAKFLIQEVGDQFCELVKQEKETLAELSRQNNQTITWRRVIQNLRELCDVCSTTLFNYHWTCGKCGFVVCVSCFKARRHANEDQIVSRWLKCINNTDHVLEDLLLTQIIAGRALDDLWSKLHKLRRELFIPEDCGCKPSESASVITPNTSVPGIENFSKEQNGDEPEAAANKSNGSEDTCEETELFGLMDDGVNEETMPTTENNGAIEEEEGDEEGFLLGLMESSSNAESQEADKENSANNDDSSSSDHNNVEIAQLSMTDSKVSDATELRNFKRRAGSSAYSIKVVPKQVSSMTKTGRLFPNVPHAWLCQGYLLRLLDPSNPGNLQMFQEQWKRGQPVIVSNVSSRLDKSIWTPESFSRDFGQKSNDLINCMTGKVVPLQKMKKFWDGFKHVKQRLRDDKGQPMLLKLKDWPPSDDFAKLLPDRYKDLMDALPLGEYTRRDGKLNLAARLPDIFCKPDLGPKMYIAYGSGLHLDKGTTNLHLDVSDAVNVMVHVGVVKDDDTTAHDNAVMKAIEDSDCDSATINRVIKNKESPGALWHIWEAKDADKIRDMMNKCALERGLKVERHHDPIHDQSWYLDSDLRKRLREEYNVVGYPILQCEGDAVFIPAGAPHQVRNLNNCIKIAEDFVSPENVGHCFYLMEQFRYLTETHTNHEDKLQIKSIVYHTLKDAVAVASAQGE